MDAPAEALPTVRDLVLRRADDDGLAVLFEDEQHTYREFTAGCVARAHLLLGGRSEGPFHVGALLDNGPEYSMLLGGAAVAGAAVVGINPTRQGAELARDITHADCGIIITESRHRGLLEGLDLGAANGRVLDVDSPEWTAALAPYSGAEPPDADIDPLAPFLLLFTSGTTGDPKAAICSQARLARIGEVITEMRKLTSEDVFYQAMPMFHSNALMAGWVPCLAAGGVGAFRRRFSASGFLPDVRRFGVTYFNYVGKPLTYILATPEQPDDADNTLRIVFGNEGAVHDLERFSRRFGVPVEDSYGSTEGGVAVSRTSDTPPNALGRADETVKILDPDTGEEAPLAVFDDTGKLLNPDEAIGELVSMVSAPTFEGYWNNPEADEERTHGGIYWSGDLAYRDADGFVYFAGRNFDWLRVDGENFAAAPVERILVRHPDIDLAAVYAVPSPSVGDEVMAAVVRRPGSVFDPEEFVEFLDSQDDLGTKWTPRYVRWADTLPQTETNKILKRTLRRERWESDDETWVRDGEGYRRLASDDADAIRAEFEARGRLSVLDV
ncbi:MAG: AMP-binding protein [Acidimicrobiia bacterium]|nr:AMP-binding protein [Acidimicrobiia bacterium]MXZ86685.1 AMP-binding protein [Acidimicrobiia bacterium]MYE72225.1 AMP-binding protein [Acidimicrobiia bacterium]MYG71307.1 AMP-binding protein [Acidimicrobiia bacterium]MYJ61062.1 AMP-binding protein [Acidimicrobiia bacterium]